jgi:hypothetical protein
MQQRRPQSRLSVRGQPFIFPVRSARMTTRRIGKPGGASSGGTTGPGDRDRSVRGVDERWSGENIRIGSMRWPSSVAW